MIDGLMGLEQVVQVVPCLCEGGRMHGRKCGQLPDLGCHENISVHGTPGRALMAWYTALWAWNRLYR